MGHPSTLLEGVKKVPTKWGTPITIKNHQIGPHNWKTFKDYENN